MLLPVVKFREERQTAGLANSCSRDESWPIKEALHLTPRRVAA